MENGLSRKILIVDDEAYIRLLIEQTLEDLEDEDVEILTAENGIEALEIVQQEKPKMIILDVMMPRMSGFEVCRTIKQDWKMNAIYIVLLTAKGQVYDFQTGIEAGANAYITKPFNPDELLDLTLKVIGT